MLLPVFFMNPFHLAIQVHDLNEARYFYLNVMGCKEGRSDQKWVDFNFYGHQLVCHHNPGSGQADKIAAIKNPVDGHGVPVPHFGVVLEIKDWQVLAEGLKEQGIKFAIEPHIRFQGQVGEQATMFFYDPSGNAIEIKAFKNINKQLFAK
jgi:extradiol dioxygenase family protein